MRNFTLVTVLLLHSLSWISVSVSEYVEVQPGESVTLLCSNFSSGPTQILWFRAVKKSKFTCISHMYEASEPATFCEGFRNGKFEMSSNTSTLFLRIKHVDLSDSGLYICGYYMQKNPVIHKATNLEVQDVLEGSVKLMSVILGALSAVLVSVIIGLTVKVVTFQTAAADGQKPQQIENVDSDSGFVLSSNKKQEVCIRERSGDSRYLCQRWISVSVSEYVEVQPGENVTLLCSNFSSGPTQILWFRAVKKSKFTCISQMYEASEPATFCEGFRNGKFEMSSNTSTLFLRIKHVDLSDSGLYICGYYMQKNPIIHESINLEVQDVLEGSAKLMSVILGALSLFLTIVNVCLAVKIRKLQKVAAEQNPQEMEMKESDELNYAFVKFNPRPERRHRNAQKREEDFNVIYSASR